MNNLTGIYLAAGRADLGVSNLDYQDKFRERDIAGCMLECDLSLYDYVIATPPCNYWSKANYQRYNSQYALDTMHLLPGILRKLQHENKPFIVENVRNAEMFRRAGLFNLPLFVFFVGRHTFWTNTLFSYNSWNLQKPKIIRNRSKLQRQGDRYLDEILINFIQSLNKTY